MNKLKCRHCKDYFNRHDGVTVPNGFYCSTEHAWAHVKPRVQRMHIAYEKQKLAKRRADIKPIKKIEDEAQASINRYVRLRDYRKGCVSCDKPNTWHGQWHASHRFAVGSSSMLRYNLWNIHKSCSVCNNHHSGNIGEYTPELIKIIGQEKFDWMVSVKSNPRKYDREYLQRLKRIFNKKARILQRRLDNERVAV